MSRLVDYFVDYWNIGQRNYDVWHGKVRHSIWDMIIQQNHVIRQTGVRQFKSDLIYNLVFMGVNNGRPYI